MPLLYILDLVGSMPLSNHRWKLSSQGFAVDIENSSSGSPYGVYTELNLDKNQLRVVETWTEIPTNTDL